MFLPLTGHAVASKHGTWKVSHHTPYTDIDKHRCPLFHSVWVIFDITLLHYKLIFIQPRSVCLTITTSKKNKYYKNENDNQRSSHCISRTNSEQRSMQSYGKHCPPNNSCNESRMDHWSLKCGVLWKRNIASYESVWWMLVWYPVLYHFWTRVWIKSSSLMKRWGIRLLYSLRGRLNVHHRNIGCTDLLL